MKIVKITNIELKNFRNLTEFNINIPENKDITILKGKNGLGKTNILHSINWCLFGKNLYDKKSFPISPIINGVEENSIQTSVKLTINGDYIVKRTYKDKKTTVEVGFIDAEGKEQFVKMSQKDFQKDFESKFVDEETMKSLTNIEYIPNMNWKDLKKLVFELIGEVKEEEVLLKDDFKLIEEMIVNFGIDSTLDTLKSKKSTIDDNIKNIETKYQTTNEIKNKYVTNEEDTKELEIKKEKLQQELLTMKENIESQNIHKTSLEESNRLFYKNEELLLKTKEEITLKENLLIQYEEVYKQQGQNQELLRQQENENLNYQLKAEKELQENLNHKIEMLGQELEIVKTNANDCKNKEVKVENEICPTCKQRLPEEEINQILEVTKNNKIKELRIFQNDIEKRKEEIETIKNNILNSENNSKLINENIVLLKDKVYKIEETQQQKDTTTKINQIKFEINNLKLKINELEDYLKNNYLQEIELVNYEPQPIVDELNEINEKLSSTATLKNLELDLENIYKELNTTREEREKTLEKIQECIKFNNIKANILKEKITKYFTNVDFRTTEFTADGLEVETFKVTNKNNVEFNECSGGEKILIGVELLTNIQKFNNVSLPILLDELSVLTFELDTKERQIIGCMADKNNGNIVIE